MDVNTPNQSLSRRILRYVAAENLAYWLTGTIVWVPFYFSKDLGMAAMLIVVPITIFFITLYSLKRIPQARWRKEIIVINITFVFTCALIDLLFWVIWRDYNALEWYLPTTKLGAVNFIGYLEMIIMCHVTYLLASKSKRFKGIQKKLKFGDPFVIITGIILFILSFISALMFW